MRKIRLSVALMLAAIAVTMLPVRWSSSERRTSGDDGDEANDPSIESILETVGEGEAIAGKGKWLCDMKCVSHFGNNHPDYVSPGCPLNMQVVIKKEYGKCKPTKTYTDAKTAIRNDCNAVCGSVNRQCYCTHDQCRSSD